jgi:CRISPR/Cas system-associated endonuclease/helicase Cas3
VQNQLLKNLTQKWTELEENIKKMAMATFGVARVDRRKKTAAKMRIIQIKPRTVKNDYKQAQKRLTRQKSID